MVTVEHAVIARMEQNGEKFELLVDPDLALKMKKGELVSLNDLLAFDTVFKDARKGDAASPEALKKVFHSIDLETIV